MEQLRRILVPVNGENTDIEAVQMACSVARRNKATVYAIYVIEVKRTLPLDAEIAGDLERAEQILSRAERVAEKANYEIETDLLQARDVGAALVEEAAERDVDVIIMGMRHRRRFGEFYLGTTVPYVLKNAPCRVWVMREPIAEAQR